MRVKFPDNIKIYIACGKTDMRKSIDGLSALVSQNFKLDPFEEPIKKTRKGYKRKDLFKDLPQQNQVFKLEKSQQVCPIDGSQLSVVGKKFIRSEIKYIPAEISVVNIYQESYECRTCKKENRPGIFNPYTPEPVLQHSYATASSVAWTMYQSLSKQYPCTDKKKTGSKWAFP